MSSRWYSIAVVLLWLASMSWLVATKIVPGMLVGKPPSYETILEAQVGKPPVGWRVSFDEQPVGWALSCFDRIPNGTTEIRSVVHFERIPVEKLIPPLFRTMLGIGDLQLPIGKLEMETESLVLVDPLNRLAGFDACLRMKPRQEVIKMSGTIKGNQLEVAIQAGAQAFPPQTIKLPENALLGDDLSPQTLLPNLRLGQTWEVPSCTFFHPNAPLEKVRATVEEVTSFMVHKRREDVWLVVYRGDPTLGLKGDKNIRGRLWVRRDGTVLKQEIRLLGVRLSFLRMGDEEAVALWEKRTSEGKQPVRNRGGHD